MAAFNYKGNPAASKGCVSDQVNTALYMTGLPPVCSYHDIFQALRGTGAVRYCHIIFPNAEHPASCAAHVEFFSRTAAESVMQSARRGQLWVLGAKPFVTWNRHGITEATAGAEDAISRVLRVAGPPWLANPAFLEAFWADHIWWGTDSVVEELTRTETGELAVVWYSFASCAHQAVAAKRALEDAVSDPSLQWVVRLADVKVTFERDPCA
ncbi:hypothetical protein GGR56DRAFT_80313 [Xylariaceae sp. FL0804]|nr:hypothetical protein GGR56DRAFT_80313 [Xylariaceae sp. FL0804]